MVDAWISQRPTFQRREWLWAAVVGVVVSAWTLWPTLTGLRQAPPQSQYLYTNVPDTSDTQVYFAFIDQNATGHALYRNIFTSEPQRAVLFNPLWLLLGGLAHFFRASPEIIFTVTRVVGGIGLVLLVYAAIAHWIAEPRWRLAALVLVVVGGGFGGLLLALRTGDPRLVWIQTQTPLLRSLPADVTYAVAYTWQSIAHSPLFVTAQLLLLGTWITIWRGGRIVVAAVLTGLLAFIHPYDPALLLGVLLMSLVFGVITHTLDQSVVRRRLATIGWLLVATLPAAGYYLWAIWREPVIRQWFHQNILLPPPLTSLLAGFGVLSVLAYLGARLVWRDRARQPVVWWLMSALMLSYLPLIPFQAKMLSLMNVPIGILATIALRHWWSTWWRTRRLLTAMVAALFAIITISTTILFPLEISRAQPVEPKYHYASNDLLQSLIWLRDTTPADSVVLGDYFTDNLVPRYARRTAYIGHNLQTIGFPRKLSLVREWFFGTADQVDEKSDYLQSERIDYVVWGPNERRFGPFNPASIPGVIEVYRQGEITIFSVPR